LNTPTKTLHLIEIKAAQKNTEFRKVLGSQFYRYITSGYMGCVSQGGTAMKAFSIFFSITKTG